MKKYVILSGLWLVALLANAQLTAKEQLIGLNGTERLKPYSEKVVF